MFYVECKLTSDKMHSTQQIIKQLATMADQIQTLSEEEHGDVAMVLYTVCACLGTDEGRRKLNQLMLEQAHHMS